MASTTFVNGSTLSDEEWFNDVNRLHYTILNDPADAAAVKTALNMSAVTTGGTSTAYTLTPSPAITAYTSGQGYRVMFNATAGATPTMNISALGAKNLKVYSSSGTKVAASATTIYANMISDVVYDGTDLVIINQIPVGAFLGATKITATNATWAPNSLTSKIIVMVVSGGGGGGGANSSTGSGEGGMKGNIAWGISTSVSGTYAATIGAGGTGTSASGGNIGGTSSFIGTGISTSADGGVGGYTGTYLTTTAIYLRIRTGESLFGAGGTPGSDVTGGAAAANTGAGGGGVYNGSTSRTGGAGGSGFIMVWEYA